MNLKKQNGVTLIVLVITIIVILILAGTSVGMILSRKGILKSAQEIQKEQQNAAEKEEQKTNDLIDSLGNTNQTETPTEPEIDPTKPKAKEISFNAKFCVVTGGDSWTNDFTLKPTITPADANQIVKWESSDATVATVDSNGVVKATNNAKGGDIKITATTKDGSNLTAECEVRVEKFGAINNIENTEYTDSSSEEKYKTVTIPKDYAVATSDNINKIDGGLVIQDIDGNQFVWVPVDETAFTKMIDETNHRGNLYNFTTSGTSLKAYSSTSCREPDTVKSYTGGSTTNPGDDVASNFTNAGITGVTDAETFKTRLQSEFNSMADSVKHYHGFFIGRYETGNLEANATNVPVVQRGNTKISGVNWYYMYAQGQRIAKNEQVSSSMIWGCQWDRTLEWIVQRNGGDYSIVTDSTDWGNYNGTTFEYLDIDGTTIAKTGINGIPTGSTERNKKNNIYDMAGNVSSRTLEAGTASHRVTRRRCLQLFEFRFASFLPIRRLAKHCLQLQSELASHFM